MRHPRPAPGRHLPGGLAPAGVGVGEPATATDPAGEPAAAAAELAGDQAPGAAAAGRSLVRNTRTMAIATVTSRVTGFLRTAVMAAVLGVGSLSQAFNIANTLPNSLYEFLLGGILTSTLVPLLVQARERDRDGGLAYAQKLFSLILVGLIGISLVTVLAAPWLVRLYSDTPSADELALSATWARFFLPQIAFYGLSALFGALLNSRGSFGPPMWAPVLNNVVVIATFVAFVLVPGPDDPVPGTLSTAQLAVLGVGTSLGVVAMTLALLPSLRAIGIRLTLRFDLAGIGLRQTGRLAAWTLVYVAATQVSYLVLSNLASAVRQQPTYTLAFTLWQLPHAVVAVSVITALLPAMSRAAVQGRLGDIRADIDRGIRLSTLLLVPAALAFLVLGRQIAILLFAHGRTTVPEASRIGWTLAVFAVGLVPFSVYQLQSRAFYAMKDTRTPALIQVGVSAVLVLVDVVLSVFVTGPSRVYVLASGHAIAYVTGVVVSVVVLRRRLGSTPAPTASALPGRWSGLGGYVARLVAAASVAAVAAGAVAALLGRVLPAGWHGALVTLVVALPVGGVVYLTGVLVLRVSEVRAMAGTFRARLGR